MGRGPLIVPRILFKLKMEDRCRPGGVIIEIFVIQSFLAWEQILSVCTY